MAEMTSLEGYIKQVESLHCAKSNGRVVIAKPMFLIALINGIDDGVFKENRFYWDKSKEQYKALSKYYLDALQGYAPNAYITPLHKPFYHMKYDGFWNLKVKEGARLPSSSSSGFMKENLIYAYFDEGFWNILQSQSNRDKIRNIIVEKYIKSC